MLFSIILLVCYNLDMDKKKLDYFDSTTPELLKGLWHIDLIYNGKVYGTLFAETEVLAKKFARRWVDERRLSDFS